MKPRHSDTPFPTYAPPEGHLYYILMILIKTLIFYLSEFILKGYAKSGSASWKTKTHR